MIQLRARGFRSVTAVGLIAGVAVAIVGAFAAQATAGTYSARFCAAGAGSGDRGPFARFGNESVFTLADACGNANGLRVSHNGGAPATEGAVGRFLAERPSGITVESISYRARGERAGGYFPQVVGTTSGDGIGIINGDQELDGSFKDFSVSGDVRRFGIQLICETGQSGCGPDPSSPPSASLRDITYTLSDQAPPAVSPRAAACSRAPSKPAPRPSPSTPATRAPASAECSWRSTASRRASRELVQARQGRRPRVPALPGVEVGLDQTRYRLEALAQRA